MIRELKKKKSEGHSTKQDHSFFVTKDMEEISDLSEARHKLSGRRRSRRGRAGSSKV